MVYLQTGDVEYKSLFTTAYYDKSCKRPTLKKTFKFAENLNI